MDDPSPASTGRRDDWIGSGVSSDRDTNETTADILAVVALAHNMAGTWSYATANGSTIRHRRVYGTFNRRTGKRHVSAMTSNEQTSGESDLSRARHGNVSAGNIRGQPGRR